MGQKFNKIILRYLKENENVKIFQISTKKAKEYNTKLEEQLVQKKY